MNKSSDRHIRDESNKTVSICFVGHLPLAFVQRDYDILRKHFSIVTVDTPPKGKIKLIKYLIQLSRKIKQADLTFSWFAGWHT